jgi:RNA polymerase sigma factor (sigma-70 family)
MAFKAKKSKAVESSTPASWSVAQFSSFYTQNRSELIAHANRIVKDKAKAEEITQEALVKFMLAAPELSSDGHGLSYLHRTIENLCIDLFRAENRRPNLVALDDATAEVESTWQVSGDHSQVISSAEDAAIIRQALSLLSPAERAALVMWEVEGRSTAEIAKELGIKESAVRHTVSRARASLRKVLSELIIDEARGLTALDLLSTTYKKAAELAGKSSKIALTFILVLTAFLGLNSLTGNEPNTSLITTSSSQLSSDQDMPENTTSVEPAVPVFKPKAPVISNSISTEEYSDHMQLSINQLETVTLMLQVLEQVDGGPAPTE